MAEVSGNNGNHVALNVNDAQSASKTNQQSGSGISLAFFQKLGAELLGTYFLIFAGCASVVVNSDHEKVVSLPGISIVWGLAVMALCYSVGHISGAHFNPAVTIAFATCKKFPWKQVPAYIATQVLGSTLAAGTLRLLFEGKQDVFAGTQPSGTDIQSFVVEFIITFYLLFIISGVSVIGNLAPIAVGSAVLINVMFAGPISGASMNPARSLGPAIVWCHFKGIWIYLTSPILGAVCGAMAHNMIKPLTKSVSS